MREACLSFPRLDRHPERNLAVEAVHVLEVPEDSAQAHVGPGRHLLGAGRDLAGLHQRGHGGDDPVAIVLPATAEAVP